jgi:hypothetical protein
MLEDDNTNNPKRFWSFIKSKRAESTGVVPLRKEEILCSNSNAKANISNDHFTSVFSYQLPGEVPTKGVSPHSAIPDINITAPGVLKLLRNINPNKATGPDTITGRLLKELATEITLDVDSDVGTRQFMNALLIQRHKRQSQRKARIPSHQHVPVQNLLGNVAKLRPHAKDSQLTGVAWYKDTPDSWTAGEKKKTKDSEKD